MRVIISILLSFCTLQAVAQQKHFEQIIGWRGKAIQLHTISDKTKQQSCTFVVGNGSIRAIILITTKRYANWLYYNFSEIPLVIRPVICQFAPTFAPWILRTTLIIV